MPITHDLVIRTGEYEDKSGEMKGRWKNVGLVIKTDAGKRLVLIDPTVNFAGFEREEGRDMVLVSMFAKDKQESQRKSEPTKAPAPDFDDDIPW